jgi:hypothetical protein
MSGSEISGQPGYVSEIDSLPPTQSQVDFSQVSSIAQVEDVEQDASPPQGGAATGVKASRDVGRGRSFQITWFPPEDWLFANVAGPQKEHVLKIVQRFKFNELGGQCLAMQQEICPETNRKHIHMAVLYKQRMRLDQIKKAHPQIHVEAGAYYDTNVKYVTKIETRHVGPFYFPDEQTVQLFCGLAPKKGRPKGGAEAVKAWLEEPTSILGKRRACEEFTDVMVRSYRGVEWVVKALQKPYERPVFAEVREAFRELYTIVTTPTADTIENWNRTIHYVFDPKGNSGKTEFAAQLMAKHGFIKLSGTKVNMITAYNGEPGVIFDISRTQADFVNHLFEFGEELKSGVIMKSKYESTEFRFRQPHVIFFSNHPLPPGTFTMDRVKMWVLSEPEPFVPFTVFPAATH